MAAPDYTRPPGIYGPEFQERRLEALERDRNRCCACDHDGSIYQLQVHHRTYKNGTKPKLEDLYTFCVRCHEVWTSVMRGARYDKRDLQAVETKSEIQIRPVIAGKENTEIVEIRATTSVRVQTPDRPDVEIQEIKTSSFQKPTVRR